MNASGVIKSVEKLIREYENKFNLLRWIDQATIDKEVGVEECFDLFLKKIEDSLSLPKTGLYATHDGSLVSLQNNSINEAVSKKIFSNKHDFSEILSKKASCFLEQEGQELWYNFFLTVTKNKRVVFIFLFQGTELTDVHDEKEIIEFLSDVSTKLSVLLNEKESRRYKSAYSRLIKSFFQKQSKTMHSWNIMASSIIDFLPGYAPFKIDPPPLVQVLTYKKNDRHLLLRATQGESLVVKNLNLDKSSVPLKIDETISGLIVEEKKNFLVVDPTDYKERYQSYMFGGDIPRSELVVPIFYEKEIIGLLNLEHQEKNVFNYYVVQIVQKIGEDLGPFVRYLIEQEDIIRNKEISSLYVMTKMLKRMSSTYRHKIGQILLKTRYLANSLQANCKGISDQIDNDIEDLCGFIDKFQERSSSFLIDLPNYIKFTRIELNKAIIDAAAEFDLHSKENRNIEINYRFGDNAFYVFASSMLREHIYNLLNNSIWAVRKRLDVKEIDKAIIEISIFRKDIRDIQNKKTSVSRVYVSINDNGGGVDPDVLPYVFDYGYTTRREIGGTGYGLPSAREYIQAIGGDLSINNKIGVGIEVELYLQEFDASYHNSVTNHKQE